MVENKLILYYLIFIPSFTFYSGGHAPSYVYRLLTELYHPEDLEI